MADIADVERGLVAQIALALFPGVAYAPGTMQASPVGLPVKLYRGWPESANLDQDLAAGNAHVSVYPDQGMTRLENRWPAQWFYPAPAAPTLTATASNGAVTIGGQAGSGQVVGVRWGGSALPVTVAYRALATDTTASVAAALGLLIPNATVVGTTVAVPTTTDVHAAVQADMAALRATRRQSQGFRVSVWAPTPLWRDVLCWTVDRTLGAMTQPGGDAITEWMTLANGESVRVRYRATYSNDVPSKDRVWKRDLCYWVQYDTTVPEALPTVLFPALDLMPNGRAIPAS